MEEGDKEKRDEDEDKEMETDSDPKEGKKDRVKPSDITPER